MFGSVHIGLNGHNHQVIIMTALIMWNRNQGKGTLRKHGDVFYWSIPGILKYRKSVVVVDERRIGTSRMT